MARLLQVGHRVIDIESVVAAEKGPGTLKVYLAGLHVPFSFDSDDADALWDAIASQVEPTDPAPEMPEFALMELPLGEQALTLE
jgi:hypothetical protein